MSFIGVTTGSVAAGIAGAGAIGAGVSGIIGSSDNGGQPNVSNVYTPGPNYQAGQTSTQDWLNQLTSDQNDPTGNFGAISPDWNDIWQQTQQQVSNYYNGTATSPGVNDQIKASFAQRGMSGDPAASYLTAASGANQASDLTNLAAQQNIAKQTFANEGKTQWLNSIASLQNQTANAPSGGNWGGQVVSPTQGQQLANIFGTTASGIGSAAATANGQNNQLSYLNSIINPTSALSFAPANPNMSTTNGSSILTNGGFGF